jgi:DNA repair photolyase
MDKANDAVGALASSGAPGDHQMPAITKPPVGGDLTTAPVGGARGRGSYSNASGRYERFTKALTDDGWGNLDEPAPPLRTTVIRDASRTIITRNQSPDISFDRSINPYRGCEHGCVYCFARPTHAWLGLSPGLDFESKLYMKPNAAMLLDKELRHPKYKPAVIAIGTNTDPYQPIEKTRKITREILKVLSAHRHPVAIVTKSAMVTRDIDILGPMAERGLAKVALSVTTLDRRLARKMEPRAATPERRLDTIKLLAKAGIPTGVMVAPLIPALNDMEIEAILARAAGAGARSAGFIVLRMPLEIKDLFREWLEEHYPDRAAHVLSLIRDMRGGKDYDATWGQRMKGKGPYAAQLGLRFRMAARRLGLNELEMKLDTSQFKPPPQIGDQMSFL